MGKLILSGDQRVENLTEMSRIHKLLIRSGWTKRLAKRFDKAYCCYMRCIECDMTKDCPRPHVKDFDPELNLVLLSQGDLGSTEVRKG